MRIVWRVRALYDRYWVLLLLGGAPLLLIYGPLLGWMAGNAVDSLREYVNRVAFDSVAWQNQALVRSRDPIRIRMIDDLLEQHDLRQLEREQVVTLLGEPDRTGSFGNGEEAYWLGPSRDGAWFASEWLVVGYDAQNCVRHFDVEVVYD